MRHTFILFFIITYVAAPLAVLGQRAAQPDTSPKIKVRKPSQNKINSYASDDAFNYTNTPKEAETFLDKLKYWLQRQFSKLLHNAAERGVFKVLFYIGISALLIILINQYMKGNLKHLFVGKNPVKPESFSIHQAKADEEHLNQLIQQAIKNNDYGLAIRYLYQKNLRNLQKHGYITWKKNKTNHDYVYEIKQDELRKIFREVTRYYEYTEYGNFSISRADFQKVHNRFKKIQTLTGPHS